MSVFAYKYPANKWRKHVILVRSPTIKKHLPPTTDFKIEKLARWLNRYGNLYLKPKIGGGGKGIIRISKWWQGPAVRYFVQTAQGKRMCTNIEQVVGVLKRYVLKEYIMQQGIDLFQINRRPVDFRVLICKVNKTWTLFGIMGKVAAKGKHVTNYSRGGDAIRLGPALQQGLRLNEKTIEQITKKMNTLSHQVAITLNKAYPQLTQLGIDLAIDRKHNIYILEANSRPQFELFRHHEDARLYERIARWMAVERSSDVL